MSKNLAYSVAVGFALSISLCVAAILAPSAWALGATYDVTVMGAGNGVVSGSGIDCNKGETGGHDTCSTTESTMVELTATADPGAAFSGWTVSGAGLQTPNPCGVSATCTINAIFGTLTITASFDVALPAPTVAIQPADEVGVDQATFRGTVNPNGIHATWHFEYRATGAASWVNLPAPDADAGSGSTAKAVQVTAERLEPSTEYEVRLHAANETSGDMSLIETFHTLGRLPDVSAGQAWSISDNTAQLVATVDPGNAPVADCRFEYGLTPAYGSAAPCQVTPPATAEPHQVVATVEALSPGTTYYFRLVARNTCAEGCGRGEGAGATFVTRTVTEAALPRRGYELVSAADTNGVQVNPYLASVDGDHFAYISPIPVPGSVNGFSGYFVSTRRSDGSWSQRSVGAPPPAAGTFASSEEGPLFSEDLGIAAFKTAENLNSDDRQSGSPAARNDVYRESADDDSLAWLSRSPEIPVGQPQTELGDERPAYVTGDGSRVLFLSERHLLPSDGRIGGSQYSLYEWDEDGLWLVGMVPPSASASCGGAVGEPQCVGSPSGSELGSGNGALFGVGTTFGAVSRDGSRIAFQARYGGSGREESLYLRIDRRRTIDLSASAVDSTPLDVRYAGADSTGDLIFFTSSSPLTPDSTAPDTGDGAADLYVYDVGDEELHDLTPTTGGANVKRVYDVSTDGRRVYFTATKPLAGNGVEHTQNLYVAELNAGGELADGPTLIASRVSDGQGLPEGNASYGPQAYREIAANESGSFIAFRSTNALVPDRQTAGLPQVYVYDAPRNELSCASCPLDGSAPAAPADLTPSIPAGTTGELTPVTKAESNFTSPHVRNVSTNGTVFFQTATPLLGADGNSTIDVYAWHGNRLTMVAPPAGATNSLFGDASSDGATVFFRSAASLVPGAEDGVQHIYAARIGGGYQSSTRVPPCHGDGCQGPSAGALELPSAATRAFHGAGNLHNVSTKRCGRHEVRRGRRCASMQRLARQICRKRSRAAKGSCIRKQMRVLRRVKRERQQAERTCRTEVGNARRRCVRAYMGQSDTRGQRSHARARSGHRRTLLR